MLEIKMTIFAYTKYTVGCCFFFKVIATVLSPDFFSLGKIERSP